MPWLGAGYKNLNQLEPPLERRLLVGSQMVRCASPGILTQAVGNEVVTQCEVGSIGNTSMEFRYRILFGDQEVATGCALMICVGGTPGNLKPSPVPDDIRGLAAEGGGEDKAFMQSALKECPADAPDDAFSMPLIIRHSDEVRKRTCVLICFLTFCLEVPPDFACLLRTSTSTRITPHSESPPTSERTPSSLIRPLLLIRPCAAACAVRSCRFFEDAKEVLMVDEAAPAELRNIAERYLDTIIVAYQA